MAKDSAKYTQCKERLDRSDAQRIAAQAWVSATFKGMTPKQLLLTLPEGEWVAHVLNATACHGGIVVVTTRESVFIQECVLVDDLVSGWLKSTCPYMRENARSIIKFRNSIVEQNSHGEA